ncbi:MAG: LolA family protein [Bacteroidia bacterium]
MAQLIRKSRLLFAGLLLATTSVFAQAEKQALRQMYATYNTAKTLRMQVNMQLFTKASDAKAVQSNSGKVFKSNENYYSEMMGRIMVINSTCCLLVDQTQKTMVYSLVEKNKSKKTDAPALLPDSVLFAQASLKTIRQTEDVHEVELLYKNDPQYSKISVSIHPKKHTLQKIVYYYKAQGNLAPAYEKVEIVYSGIVLNEAVSSAQFSEKTFVAVGRDKIVGLGQYAQYEIIDQRKYNQQAKQAH